MRVLSLFSGIGGLDLAAEWAGMKTVAFCEIDDYACKVLEKRWPGVPIYRDVRQLTAERLRKDGIGRIDCVVGGWPCQDNSRAKQCGEGQQGLGGARSGLWWEYHRIISELRPRFVVGENVPDILVVNGGGDWAVILSSLAEIGYDAEWCNLFASRAGAPHHRERMYMVAYPNSIGVQEIFAGVRHVQEAGKGKRCRNFSGAIIEVGDCWSRESIPVRVAHGVPNRVDRIRTAGNAVVPQQAYPIFKAIMEVEHGH